MPIASPKYRFTRKAIDQAPTEPGVYILYEEEDVLYIGRVELPSGIQTRLLEHLYRLRDPSFATHYGWEICRDPRRRQAELIREHQRAFLRRPPYNDEPFGPRSAGGPGGASAVRKGPKRAVESSARRRSRRFDS